MRGVLLEEMDQANRSLEVHGFRNVWTKEITALQQWNTVFPALIDALLLRDVLRNLLRNVRHTFTDTPYQEGIPWADRVKVRLEIVDLSAGHIGAYASDDEDQPEADKFVRLTIESFGNPFNPPLQRDAPSTLAQQRQKVENLGGSLEVAPIDNEEGSGVRATLMLHTRRRVFERIGNDGFE